VKRQLLVPTSFQWSSSLFLNMLTEVDSTIWPGTLFHGRWFVGWRNSAGPVGLSVACRVSDCVLSGERVKKLTFVYLFSIGHYFKHLNQITSEPSLLERIGEVGASWLIRQNVIIVTYLNILCLHAKRGVSITFHVYVYLWGGRGVYAWD